MDIIFDLFRSYDPDSPHFRPTEIYNECWLIKIVLSLASTIPPDEFPLSFLSGSSWFSEALLPTVFKPRQQKDPLGEARTNADGVIGHFEIGKKAKADFELEKDAKQFSVVEAKINVPLSKGVINAPYFDQAARNVACMAESLARADLSPSSIDRLAFIILAPERSIKKCTFEQEMTKDSIQAKTEQRVSAYQGEKEVWYRDWFIPTLDRIQLHTLSWEQTIDWLTKFKPDAREQLVDFYSKCLEYN